jgi:hypothetical protein
MRTLEAGARTCTVTGVRLVPASGGTVYRVAKDRGRAVLEGFPNAHVGALPPGTVDLRGRWDTFGRTVYFADSPQTAFAEVLAPLMLNRSRLAVAAARAGYTGVEEYAAHVLGQAADNDVDRPWAVSCRWQFVRSIYHVWMPTRGWWVQIDHADTLRAVQRAWRAVPGMPDPAGAIRRPGRVPGGAPRPTSCRDRPTWTSRRCGRWPSGSGCRSCGASRCSADRVRPPKCPTRDTIWPTTPRSAIGAPLRRS